MRCRFCVAVNLRFAVDKGLRHPQVSSDVSYCFAITDHWI